MIAVDTNIFVYAHREDSPWHAKAYDALQRLAEARQPWALPWSCLHEFLGIVTHQRIYEPPTPPEAAVDQVAAWIESPSAVLLTETHGYWDRLRELICEGQVTGPRLHDARIAALCLHHGAEVLWSADRDFTRFPALKTRNPLID